MALTQSELDGYLSGLESDQRESVTILRELLIKAEPTLDETICTDKWWNGLLVYTAEGVGGIYALGPKSGGKTTFHMLPYYMCAELEAKHGASLKKFLTGKSCIAFRHASDLPLDALEEIMTGGAARAKKAIDERNAAKKVRG